MSSRKPLLLASAALAALLLLLGLLLPRPPWPGAGDPGKTRELRLHLPDAGRSPRGGEP